MGKTMNSYTTFKCQQKGLCSYLVESSKITQNMIMIHSYKVEE